MHFSDSWVYRLCSAVYLQVAPQLMEISGAGKGAAGGQRDCLIEAKRSNLKALLFLLV